MARRVRPALWAALTATLAMTVVVVIAARRRGDPAVTFARDIAPIVWRKCAPCHRPGEPGPFSLLSYGDVAKRARQIEKVTRTRFMPPWKPVPGYADYANDRSLDDDQIDLIRRWALAGAPEGDPRDAPAMPDWPTGWQLGTPDLVVRMPAPFTVPADGNDIYRNFVLPTGVTGSHWVAAWELRTEGAKTIHHAIVNIDRHGWARQHDGQDGEPGYPGMDPGEIQAPDGFYLVWTPGKVPAPPIPGAAWQIDASTDLVLQLHLQPSGRPQTVQPTIGLYFTTTPPTVARLAIRIGDPPIDIAAGVADYSITDSIELPVDSELFGLFPHAHYLARKMRVWAVAPGGSKRWLLAIDDWDFAWQDEYTFTEPQHLPRGTVVTMEFHYDNSADNDRNPNDPPKRVGFGPRSVDEMGNVTLELAASDPRDLDALRETKYRHQLAQAPDDARGHFNLGNALARQGKRAAAIAEYVTAQRLDPQYAAPSFNLANLLLDAGRSDEAIAAFEAALRAQPAFPEAELNLGNALVRKGDRAGAVAHLRRALVLRPGYPEAEGALAAIGERP